MPTVFTRILNGELPGVFVWRDDRCAVFLSINPLARGHALVVPVEEIDHWVDASVELSNHLMEVAHAVGRAQVAAFPCERVGLIVAGYEVPHLHVHVVPTVSMAQLSFEHAARSVDPDDLRAAGAELRAALRAQGHGAVVPEG